MRRGKLGFAIAPLVISFFAMADSVSNVDGQADAAAAPVAAKHHEACFALLNRVLAGFGYGAVDEKNPSNPITGAYASRFRFSPKSGMPLVAAVLKKGKGADVEIFKALPVDYMGTQPALNAPKSSPRIQSIYNGKEFSLNIRSSIGPIVIRATPSQDGDKCVVKEIEVDVQVRDLEAEKNDRDVLKSQGIENPKIDPIYRWQTKTISAQDCPRTSDSIDKVNDNPLRAHLDTCQLLKPHLPAGNNK